MGKKARVIAAYMNDAVRKINRVIAFEQKNLEQERDKEKRTNIEMGLYQYKAFNQIVSSQLDKLIKTIDALPNVVNDNDKPMAETSQIADKTNMPTPMPTPDSPYVMIYIGRFGEIIVDGKSITTVELKNVLKDLAYKRGIVLYTRESPNASQEPPAITKEVLNLVANNRLPIKLCTNGDFSDAVETSGKLRINATPTNAA